MSFRVISSCLLEAHHFELTILKGPWSKCIRYGNEEWDVMLYKSMRVCRLRLSPSIVHYQYDSVATLLAEELNARIAYIDELEIKLVCMPCDQTWTDCCNAVKEEVLAIELRR